MDLLHTERRDQEDIMSIYRAMSDYLRCKNTLKYCNRKDPQYGKRVIRLSSIRKWTGGSLLTINCRNDSLLLICSVCSGIDDAARLPAPELVAKFFS